MFGIKNKKNIENIKPNKTLYLFGDSVDKDWKILISFLFSILVLSLIFSWSVYKSINTDSVLSEEEFRQRSSLRVDTGQLERVVSNLNKKKEKFDSLILVPDENESEEPEVLTSP